MVLQACNVLKALDIAEGNHTAQPLAIEGRMIEVHNEYPNEIRLVKSYGARISSHRLQIERGRYQGALRQDRLCLRCTTGEIDDEKHFLISCSTCPVIRTEMFSRINNICQNFHVHNSEQKLYWLLNNENEEILASICNLIEQSTI